MVKSTANVSDVRILDEQEQASKQADGSADFPSIGSFLRRRAVEATEEFVRAVNEMDFHR